MFWDLLKRFFFGSQEDFLGLLTDRFWPTIGRASSPPGTSFTPPSMDASPLRKGQIEPVLPNLVFDTSDPASYPSLHCLPFRNPRSRRQTFFLSIAAHFLRELASEHMPALL